MSAAKHKWSFASSLRRGVFGWKSSKLAIQRLKQAVSEVKKVSRKDPLLGAEGAVLVMEKLYPAVMYVDSSSGALGNATNKVVHELVELIIAAPADEKTRAKWLDRIWTAFERDGWGVLQEAADRWGELCGSREAALRRADELMPRVVYFWTKAPGVHFNGTTACISCLVAAGRYEELLGLLELAPHPYWHYRRYGVKALVAMGRRAEATKSAEDSQVLYGNSGEIAAICEEILLSSGMIEEAYRRYGRAANLGNTPLDTFRNIVRKYPGKDKLEIFDDLIQKGAPGKWFVTAKELGLYDRAIDLANRSYCDPRTLTRAAWDYMDREPEFALECAVAALKWLAQGHGWEITSRDVHEAYDRAMTTAENLGLVTEIGDLVQVLVENDMSPGGLVRQVLGRGMKDQGRYVLPAGGSN